MEKTGTKQAILNAALDLFSVQGFEATSVSQIADAVGIRKASLYSHFPSKQAILDALMQDMQSRYEARSIFTQNIWKDGRNPQKCEISVDTVAELISKQVRYILHDPEIRKVRKMLTIEQFRNPALAEALTKRNYTAVMGYFTDMMRFFIQQEQLEAHDAEIMAAQLCLPISVWINLCDREPEREPEAMELIERTVRQFFDLYRKRNDARSS